ncbi:hypothetical protein [Sphingomonas sp.]
MHTQTYPPRNPAKHIKLPTESARRIARQIAENSGVVTVLGGEMGVPL